MNNPPPTLRTRIATRIGAIIAGQNTKQFLASITAVVNDTGPWRTEIGGTNDRPLYEIEKAYKDTLIAWRKNPLVWRVVSIVRSYVLGDGIAISSSYKAINKYIEELLSHDLNKWNEQIEQLCDELTRSGDLFILLFRQPEDGMSWIRAIPKDRIAKIETRDNDWLTEIGYTQKPNRIGEEPQYWYGVMHDQAHEQNHVMLHFSINRPVGALLGEGDLTATLPWLQRYSRLLEDRVRLHWAIRAFLWFVKVPAKDVEAKTAKYKEPPDSGSVIVHDEAEEWEVKTPSVRGADAQPDMNALRKMIYAGVNMSGTWFGEEDTANLASATAAKQPPERFLKRRQLYFIYIILTIIHTSYQRAYEIGKVKAKPPAKPLNKIYQVAVTDISRDDNLLLAQSGRELGRAYRLVAENLPKPSRTLSSIFIQAILNAIGNTTGADVIDTILNEAFSEQGETNETDSNNQD